MAIIETAISIIVSTMVMVSNFDIVSWPPFFFWNNTCRPWLTTWGLSFNRRKKDALNVEVLQLGHVVLHSDLNVLHSAPNVLQYQDKTLQRKKEPNGWNAVGSFSLQALQKEKPTFVGLIFLYIFFHIFFVFIRDF